MADDDVKFERQTFRKGDLLVREGEPGDTAYFIVLGEVEIRKFERQTFRKGDLLVREGGTDTKILATRTRGDVIGEMALFDDEPPMASAVATKKTFVDVIPRDVFQGRIDEMDPAMRQIMKLMVQRIRDLSDELLRHGGGTTLADSGKKN
jgi:serine/threonine-protein kinase